MTHPILHCSPRHQVTPVKFVWQCTATMTCLYAVSTTAAVFAVIAMVILVLNHGAEATALDGNNNNKRVPSACLHDADALCFSTAGAQLTSVADVVACLRDHGSLVCEACAEALVNGPKARNLRALLTEDRLTECDTSDDGETFARHHNRCHSFCRLVCSTS